MTISVYTKERRYKAIKDKIRKNKKLIILAIIIIFLIIIDQIAKIAILKNIYNSSITVIQGILNFTYVENTGGAFGIGNNSTITYVIVNIIIIILIAKFILSKNNELSTYILVGLGLILAGGMGNLIDRIFRGFVVDYIDFNPLIKYPVFNIADICVVIGCLIIGVNLVVNTINERKE